MRILILHSRYLSGAVSGENRVVEDEARLLREHGHEVGVWSPSPDVSGAFDRARSAAAAVWSASAAARVRREARRRAIDVVHVHNLFPVLSPAVLRAARAAGAATVVTLHNFRLLCLPANLLRDGRICEDCVGRVPWRGVVHRCYRGSALGSATLATSLTLHRAAGTFDGVTRFLAVSGFVRRKHIEAGLSPARIAVKPNFAWPTAVREGPGGYVLFLGRLSGEKGVDTLVDAWRLADSPGRLVVVGAGPAEDDLRRRTPPGVEFRGEVPPAEVPDLLRGARALALPSRWYEAAPRTIVEAYAAGVPVVASDLGALPEAVEPGVTGYLAPADDPAGWAEVLRRLQDDAESRRLGEGARRAWRERFSPERGIEELTAAYRAALADRDAGR